MPRTSLALIAITTFALGLAGCAPTAEIAEPPVVTPTQTPTPSATPEAPVVSAIVLTASTLDLAADGGEVLESFNFYVEGEDTKALEALTELLGPDPETRVDEAETHFPRMTKYSWGDFTFVDTEPESGGTYPTVTEFFVRSETASIDGLSVRATDGTAVGTSISDLDVSKPMSVTQGDGFEETTYGILRVDVTDDLDYDQGSPAFIAVWASASTADDLVFRIGAPAANFGA